MVSSGSIGRLPHVTHVPLELRLSRSFCAATRFCSRSLSRQIEQRRIEEPSRSEPHPTHKPAACRSLRHCAKYRWSRLGSVLGMEEIRKEIRDVYIVGAGAAGACLWRAVLRVLSPEFWTVGSSGLFRLAAQFR